MQRVVKIKLLASPEQKAVLRDTVAHCTACFNAVAAVAWDKHLTNSVKLHHETYYALRAEHPTLPAQLVIAARVKACEAVRSAFQRRKRGKKATCPKTRGGAVRCDARSYSFWPDRQEASLATTSGRLRLRVAIPAYFQTMLDQASGFSSADLVFYSDTGDYWLHLVVTLPEPVVSCSAAAQVIGVDVGISRIAVSSDNCFFAGKRVKEHAHRMFRLRRALQATHALARSASEGTRSAKRHLRRLRQRENRFRADVNHCVSKRLVETLPPGSVIVMENLTNIRERVRARRARRREMHNWSFGQLQAFVAYKAAARGIQVEFADPRYSSQACSRCGHISRSNRKTQSWFSCVKCGYQSNADLNAARNLALRARGAQSGLFVNQPIVSPVDAKAPSLANCG